MTQPIVQELLVQTNHPMGREDSPGPCRLLRLAIKGWPNWRPGQFVMLRPADWGPELTWGRPFSICTIDDSADDATLTIFYQIVGRGTTRLAELSPGDRVLAWGPLGNGFRVPDGPALLLAGGVGIAPFVGLSRTHGDPSRLRLAFGHRLDLESYPWDLMHPAMAKENHLERQPGDLARFIARMEELMASERSPVMACGPLPFLRTVRELALKHDVDAQLSLENRMACGVGACLGCVADIKDRGLVQTCTHGPVFDARDVLF